jgi:hypothetical protein
MKTGQNPPQADSVPARKKYFTKKIGDYIIK